MIPKPSPIKKRPGTYVHTLAVTAVAMAIGKSRTRSMPTVVKMKPMIMSLLWVVLVASFLALTPVSSIPIVAGVSIRPAPMALNPRNR